MSESKVNANDNNNKMAAVKDVIASVVASAACVYTGQPFDTIKVRIQVQPGLFINPIDAIKTTIRDEGIIALWRGAVPAFIGALGENMMAFGVNGFLKRMMIHDDDKKKMPSYQPSLVEPFITGAITGAFIPLVLCPCDVIKCRQQMSRDSGQDNSLRHVIRNTYSRQGLRGFFTGFNIQFTREIIFYSSFFGTYDVACMMMKKHTSLSDPVIYFTAGGLAGQVAWILSIATDTIKSRIQTASTIIPPTITAVSKEIYRTQGYRGFFRGIEVAVIRAFPANAALFLGYEFTLKGLNKIF